PWPSTGSRASVVVGLYSIAIALPPSGWEGKRLQAPLARSVRNGFSRWTGRHARHLLLAGGRGLLNEPQPDVDGGGDQAANDWGEDEHPQLAEGGAADEEGRSDAAGGVHAGAAEPEPGEVHGEQRDAY